LPVGVKRAGKRAQGRLALGRALRELKRMGSEQLPDRGMLERISSAWGNEGFSVRLAYLEELVHRVAVADRPVLECGSGVSTLVMGAVAGPRGTQIWTLENMPYWHDRLAGVLERFQLSAVRLFLAPLRDFGEYSWYDVRRCRLPDEFGLVACDGPVGTTPGGRYGLLPALGDRIPAGATILYDDVSRSGELQVLERWKREFAVEADIFPQEIGAYAVLRRARSYGSGSR
jgi:hypothetical protein